MSIEGSSSHQATPSIHGSLFAFAKFSFAAPGQGYGRDLPAGALPIDGMDVEQPIPRDPHWSVPFGTPNTVMIAYVVLPIMKLSPLSLLRLPSSFAALNVTEIVLS